MAEVMHLFDKPFEELEWEELKLERRAHGWLRRTVERNAYHLTTKLYKLEEQPLYTKEEYRKMYEDGELTQQEYKVMAMNMTNLKSDIAATKAQIKFGFAVVDREVAICTELDEIIAHRRATYVKPRKAGTKSYDPRKRVSWQNHNSKHPTNRLHPERRTSKMKKKWSVIRENEKSASYNYNRLQPLATWDRDKLVHIARARGALSDQTMIAMVAEELGTTVSYARKILASGKMTWGQCIVIGALFEMTPAEFCDVFLSGVFQEVVDGKWVAVVDDKAALLDKLSYARPSCADDEETDISCGEEESEETPL